MSDVPRTAAEHKQHFVVLDGLRGVAAFAVAAGHTWATFRNNTHLPHTGQAVDFFFMLSGFVLLYAYREKVTSGAWDFQRFMLTRAVRLYPMILIGAVFGSLSLVLLGEWGRAGLDLFPTATTVPLIPLTGNSDYSDPPTWSLFFELLASALFFPAIRFVRLRGWIVLTAVCGVAFAAGTILTHDDNFGYRAANFGWAFARAGFGFSTGALLYYAHQSFGRSLPKLPWPVAAALLFASFAVPWTVGAWAPELATVFVLYPALVLLSAGSPIRTKVETRALKAAGDLSYPLYIMHWPLYVGFAAIITRLHGHYERHATPFAILALGGAIIASWIVLKRFDEPRREAISAALRRRGWKVFGRPASRLASEPAVPPA